jgi:hypothetical protein
MRVVVWKSRAIAMGLVFAAAGFCLAVSTMDSDGPSAGNRAVGSTFPLRFTNPLLPGFTNEYDLGDACFGSVITRYVSAEGGLRPYRFTSFGSQSLTNVIEGFRTNLQFGLSGILAGSMPPMVTGFPATTATGAPGFRFFVQVQDAKGTNASTAQGYFNLFLVDCTDQFKFAMDQIPSARLADSYLTKIEVLGGNGEKTFSLRSVSGPGVASAKDLGIFIGTDGTLLGRPLKVGTFALTVRCVDAGQKIATSRNGAGPDQTFQLVVGDNPISSSDNTTLQCTVRGDLGGGARDSLRYKSFVNVLGQDDFKLLNSEFSFRMAGVGFSGRLDGKGQFAAILRDRSKVSVKVNASKGTADVKISAGAFTKALGFDVTPPVPGITRLPVQLTIGDAVASSEVLDFDTDVNGSRYALNYRLGRTGANAAGGFQITSVRGKDQPTFSGQPGDAWRASFLAMPRVGVTDSSGTTQSFSGVNAAAVRIGQNFTQNITSATLRTSSGAIRFSGTVADGVRKLSINTKSFAGKLQTNVVSSKSTGILPAIQAPKAGNSYFPLGVDLVRTTGASYSGEHARRIFGLKNQYKDVPFNKAR